jgi:flagellin
MALGVLNNLSAIYAENNLNNTNNSLQTVLQQLSSGSRINSGADDAAGLSLVNGLGANSAALTQSETNATEGVGLLQVADGALSQVTSLLNRSITLATEASNGTLNSTQESAANQEYQSILAEINNIGSTTTYNQQQVFNNTTTAIYTGDSSQAGSSVDDVYIRTLSSSSIGDTDGAMSYSSGQNNVFIDLSKGGVNASVTDSLNASGSTTINVSYVTKGAGGSVTNATANITVGTGTAYQNTAQGLINAINNAGLGLDATFTSVAMAGSAATAAADAANSLNAALLTGNDDTGVEISGNGVGVNSSVAGNYTNGPGEVGTLTVANTGDELSGSLGIVSTDGTTHTLNLGTPASTDTLANLETTINSLGYGVTASLNTTSVTNASGMHGIGTVLTLTAANSAVSVSGTGLTDTELNQPTVALANVAPGAGAGTTMATLTVAASTDTLTGGIEVQSDATAGAVAATQYNLDGQTLASIMAYVNAHNGAAGQFANITAALNVAGTTLTFTQTAAQHHVAPAITAAADGATITDNSATTGVSIALQTSDLGAGVLNANLGTVTVSNASDSLTGGTLSIIGADGVLKNFALGVTAGGLNTTTDNLTDLAATINHWATVTDATAGITAVVNQAGTALTISAAAGAVDPAVYGNNISTSLPLTGTPTPNSGNSTIMGILSLPLAGASGDTLSGTLTVGTEVISLGTPGKTNTMANLAATINANNYGFTAILNSTGTALTFSTPDSIDSTINPSVALATDTSTGGTHLTWSTANEGQTSSQYYSTGIGSLNGINDTSTGGGTGTVGMSFDQNGTGGIATTSYTDGVGANLNTTDLTSQGQAEATLNELNTAIIDVSSLDGYIGAQINTLNAISQVMSTQQENIISAQNAVQATDYASATSNMSKYEILSQTGIAALAQANQVQQEVTKLLQ